MDSTRDRLEAQRDALNKEIRNYPALIAGCDQQFEHLLEQRARITEKLRAMGSPAEKSSSRKG
jgi:hypothetical protein